MCLSCPDTKQAARHFMAPLSGTLNARKTGMFYSFHLGLSPVELAKRTVKETIDDDCLSISAQLSYYFALALFPALLFIAALASYLPYDTVNEVVNAIAPIAPPEVLEIIRKQLA